MPFYTTFEALPGNFVTRLQTLITDDCAVDKTRHLAREQEMPVSEVKRLKNPLDSSKIFLLPTGIVPEHEVVLSIMLIFPLMAFFLFDQRTTCIFKGDRKKIIASLV